MYLRVIFLPIVLAVVAACGGRRRPAGRPEGWGAWSAAEDVSYRMSEAPLQSEEELGEYRSAGCVRQSLQHAAFLYEWAPEGTPVIVPA